MTALPKRLTRSLMLTVVTVQLSGCTYWAAAAADRPEPEGKAVQVWQGRKAIVLRHATFTPDSVVGTQGPRRERRAIGRAEIDSIRTSRTDVTATVVAATISAAVVSIVIFLSTWRTD